MFVWKLARPFILRGSLAGSVFIPYMLVLIVFAQAVPQSHAILHDRGPGQPIGLAGKRIVFTNWAHVYPGEWTWIDQEGKSVYASSEAALGPWESDFVTTDTPRGIRIVAEPARRIGPAIPMDRPWEGKHGLRVECLLHEDGKYKMWGLCSDPQGEMRKCYFESADGYHWEKPNLGLVEFNASKANNLAPGGGPTVFFRDVNAPPKERYKGVNGGHWDIRQPEGKALYEAYKAKWPVSQMSLEFDPGRFVHVIRGYVSPDGFEWRELDEPILAELSDTVIVSTFMEQTGKYVMFTRGYLSLPRADGVPQVEAMRHQFSHRRAISRTASEDFRHFPFTEVIVQPGPELPPTDSFYTNCYTRIPGAPDHHVMFPAVYHTQNDATSIDIYASHDGEDFFRVPGSPVLEVGAFGAFDGGCMFAYPNLVELPDGAWMLPYTGYAVPHKYPRGSFEYGIGLMIWDKGRMVALEAPGKGEFATQAVIAPGTRLKINALVQRSGSIRVEAADLSGKPLEGRTFAESKPIIGDQFWTPVTWNGAEDLGIASGEPLVLRFRMDMAKIYGLEFE